MEELISHGITWCFLIEKSMDVMKSFLRGHNERYSSIITSYTSDVVADKILSKVNQNHQNIEKFKPQPLFSKDRKYIKNNENIQNFGEKENLEILLEYFNSEYQKIMTKSNSTVIYGQVGVIKLPSPETRLKNLTKTGVNVCCSSYVVGFNPNIVNDDESACDDIEKLYVYNGGSDNDMNAEFTPIFTPKYGQMTAFMRHKIPFGRSDRLVYSIIEEKARK